MLKLENGNFVFISWSGQKDDLDAGVIDCQEFNNMEEAVKIFEGLYGI